MPLRDTGVGSRKRVSFASWHNGKLCQQRALQGRCGEQAAWAGGRPHPLFLLLKDRCCDVLAEHPVQLTLQLVSPASRRAVPCSVLYHQVSCLPASVYWHSSGKCPVWRLQPTSYGPGLAQDDTANCSVIPWAAGISVWGRLPLSLQIIPYLSTLNPMVSLRFFFFNLLCLTPCF